MEVYRTLLENHGALRREVEEIPGGVRTTTTTDNPDLAALLQRHVSQMKALVEGGGRIRSWDPLFSEIFSHAEKIDMAVEQVENGVRVIETSDDEKVVALIRSHAEKVDQFIERGAEAYREETPLPEGYDSVR